MIGRAMKNSLLMRARISRTFNARTHSAKSYRTVTSPTTRPENDEIAQKQKMRGNNPLDLNEYS